MNREIIFLPSAIDDMATIADFLTDEADEDTAHRFAYSAFHVFDLLATTPGMGTARQSIDPRLQGLRMFPIPRFSNYLVFYRASETAIEIVHVMHGSRNIKQALSLSDED